MTMQLNRRGFLKTTGALGAGFVVGFNTSGSLAVAAHHSATDLNAFVRVSEDGTVTAILKHFEMGQGTTTGLTTLIAEEMDLPWGSVKTSFAPSDNETYKNLAFGSQGTGGSTAIANSWDQYRVAGAGAREMLVRAAAKQWGVEPDQVRVEDGVFKTGDKTAAIADLVAEASVLEAPAKPLSLIHI